MQEVTTKDLYNDVARREIASIYRSDLSILTSDYEMRLLQERFTLPSEIIHLCPFMFAEQQIHTITADFSQRQHFMTIGNFRHAPNWDAVLWLKQSIWPLIRAQLPQAEMHVYGAYAPAKAMALHHPASGFHVLGRADDVDEVMQQAKLCLAPLRFGAGIKTKLADAMRNGTPSISTSIGAEGMSGGKP
ncbi:MAG: glycosyltransferase [Mariprofundus sp.]|nr:glycosyltransferase [Mariprofundus sp.]